MDKQTKLIKKIWKAGAVGLVVMTLTAGGLFLNLKSALATDPTPHMTIMHEVSGPSSSSWSHSVTVNPGDTINFYAEIHNTIVGSTAKGVVVSGTMPTGNFVDGTSTASVRAENANSASDNASIHINGGGKLEELPGTTRLTWDVNGDGNKEYNNTFIAGSPFEGSGLLLGDQNGCNNFIIQIAWSAKVVGNPASPTPTPTPVISPTPTPTSGGNNNNNQNNQSQEQTQNNNQTQTVNVTNNTSTPQVLSAAVPVKSPDTGVPVAGLMTMFGAGPVGLALSRFGRGKAFIAKRKENLAELAKNLVDNRSGKSQDA